MKTRGIKRKSFFLNGCQVLRNGIFWQSQRKSVQLFCHMTCAEQTPGVVFQHVNKETLQKASERSHSTQFNGNRAETCFITKTNIYRAKVHGKSVKFRCLSLSTFPINDAAHASFPTRQNKQSRNSRFPFMVVHTVCVRTSLHWLTWLLQCICFLIRMLMKSGMKGQLPECNRNRYAKRFDSTKLMNEIRWKLVAKDDSTWPTVLISFQFASGAPLNCSIKYVS